MKENKLVGQATPKPITNVTSVVGAGSTATADHTTVTGKKKIMPHAFRLVAYKDTDQTGTEDGGV